MGGTFGVRRTIHFAHGASNAIDYVNNKASYFRSSDYYKNKTAKINLGISGLETAGVLFRKSGVDISNIPKFEYFGGILPIFVTQLALKEASNYFDEKNEWLSQAVRDFDGRSDVPQFHTKKSFSDNFMTERGRINIINLLPSLQQQGALNIPILTSFQLNRNNEIYEDANFIANYVGGKYETLPFEYFSGLSVNSFWSHPAVGHIQRDVPDGTKKLFKKKASASDSDSKVLEIIEKIGASCEISGQSAHGALKGTKYFNKRIQKEIGCGGEYRIAEITYTDEKLDGVIAARNDNIINGLYYGCKEIRKDQDVLQIKKSFLKGASSVKKEGKEIKELAEVQSIQLADENIKAAKKL